MGALDRANEPDPGRRPGLQTLFHAGSLVGVTDGQLLERFALRDGASSEAAFAALVERHERLVWRTCRAVLRDEHDAADAFQATFLVLVRKAGSLWVRDSLAPWLHRVACRAAIQAGPRRGGARGPNGARPSSAGPDRRRDARRPGRSPSSGDRPPARTASDRRRALRPRGAVLRGGGAASPVPGGDGQEPAGAGPRPTPGGAGPTGLRADGPRPQSGSSDRGADARTDCVHGPRLRVVRRRSHQRGRIRLEAGHLGCRRSAQGDDPRQMAKWGPGGARGGRPAGAGVDRVRTPGRRRSPRATAPAAGPKADVPPGDFAGNWILRVAGSTAFALIRIEGPPGRQDARLLALGNPDVLELARSRVDHARIDGRTVRFTLHFFQAQRKTYPIDRDRRTPARGTGRATDSPRGLDGGKRPGRRAGVGVTR